MKSLIALAGALALTTAANAQTVIKETEAGVHSAPVAGATPNARQRPADDTTMLEKRSTTTVIEPRERTVIERREAPSVEVETRSR
ncbi:hypothetical protein IHQ68_08460 [Chelatococcus sambhunathii]|uniref:Uncharacterized protein n=1 Tax=Chelatococcus sambhunathii TaxID=363953 RepID=A0ABU1DEU7_9HYPH|nr:hypothetical protein [Chelatococcus sambhunathii]MDR4306648.1 hypothetical protein [Chelatococcus sambhunathii]